MLGIEVFVILDTIPLNAKLVIRNHPHKYTSPGTEQGPKGSPLLSI
jgi:hypothetical protein